MIAPARTPEPPYYAVVFVSTPSSDTSGYDEAAGRMAELAALQPGFLGIDSARGDDGLGVTVSYWESEQAITAWKADLEHEAVRNAGRARWYESYELRVAKVERAYAWQRDADVSSG